MTSNQPAAAFESTLCLPDRQKSCFACCPPIRPAGYEHIQDRRFIQRMLREHTRAFPANLLEPKPITGFSCWALGYLDDRYRLVGCLLHPAKNNGCERRHLIRFGDKCRRESCPPAMVFQTLEPEARRFWIRLTDGLDAFQYSSRRWNPLFNLMGWGRKTLQMIWEKEGGTELKRQTFLRAYPFFSTSLHPSGHAYLLHHFLESQGPGILKRASFCRFFEKKAAVMAGQLKKIPVYQEGSPFTHRLNMDPDFLNFLRLSVGIRRIDLEGAEALKEMTDDMLLRDGPDNDWHTRRDQS